MTLLDLGNLGDVEGPNDLLAVSLAAFSTRLTPANASVLSLLVAELPTICNTVPLAAEPVPAANGRIAATRYICQPLWTNEQSSVKRPSAIRENRVYVRSKVNVCCTLGSLVLFLTVDVSSRASNGCRSLSSVLACLASASRCAVHFRPAAINTGKAKLRKTPRSIEYMKMSQPFSLVPNPKTSVAYNCSVVGREPVDSLVGKDYL